MQDRNLHRILWKTDNKQRKRFSVLITCDAKDFLFIPRQPFTVFYQKWLVRNIDLYQHHSVFGNNTSLQYFKSNLSPQSTNVYLKQFLRYFKRFSQHQYPLTSCIFKTKHARKLFVCRGNQLYLYFRTTLYIYDVLFTVDTG